MQRAIYILLLCLLATGASAQQMSERSLVRKGNRQYNKGNYDKSIDRYTEAHEAAPASFEATYNLGNALYKAERFDAAEQTLRAAAADTLRMTEERAESLYNLGNAQFRQERYKEALESYKQSLRLNPADQQAKYNYAYTKRLLEQNKEDQQQEDQNKDQQDQQDKQDQQDQQDKQDQQDQSNNPQDEPQQQPSEPQQGISAQEQERMLEAIQAQEDRTQEKLKEREGVVVRGHKNW